MDSLYDDYGRPLVARGFKHLTKAERRANAAKQLRDRKGRFVFMGGRIKWLLKKGLGKAATWDHGTFEGMTDAGKVQAKRDRDGALVEVDPKDVERIEAKASLHVPVPAAKSEKPVATPAGQPKQAPSPKSRAIRVERPFTAELLDSPNLETRRQATIAALEFAGDGIREHLLGPLVWDDWSEIKIRAQKGTDESPSYFAALMNFRTILELHEKYKDHQWEDLEPEELEEDAFLLMAAMVGIKRSEALKARKAQGDVISRALLQQIDDATNALMRIMANVQERTGPNADAYMARSSEWDAEDSMPDSVHEIAKQLERDHAMQMRGDWSLTSARALLATVRRMEKDYPGFTRRITTAASTDALPDEHGKYLWNDVLRADPGILGFMERDTNMQGHYLYIALNERAARKPAQSWAEYDAASSHFTVDKTDHELLGRRWGSPPEGAFARETLAHELSHSLSMQAYGMGWHDRRAKRGVPDEALFHSPAQLQRRTEMFQLLVAKGLAYPFQDGSIAVNTPALNALLSTYSGTNFQELLAELSAADLLGRALPSILMDVINLFRQHVNEGIEEWSQQK